MPENPSRRYTNNDEWRTPPWLFAKLNETFQFDHDLFAAPGNALLESYSTSEGTYVYGQRVYSHTGFELPLDGRRVFANPPYSRGLLARAVEHLYNERQRAAVSVALLPASTDTKWFHRYVKDQWIEFLPRIKFINPETGEEGKSPPRGSMIVVFRKDYTRAV